MTRSRYTIDLSLKKARRGVLYVLSAAILGAWFLAYFVKINDVVTAAGEVVPENSMLTVHAPEAGLVTQVFVSAGDNLAKDAPILALDPNFSADKIVAMQRQLAAQQEEKSHLERTLALLNQVLAKPESIRNDSARSVGLSGDTFNLINDLYKAQLELDGATEFRKINAQRQKDQITSEIALVERNIDLLKRNLDVSKREASAREAALNTKRTDFEALLKLADKGLVSATDVSHERDALLGAELSVTENHKQVDQIEIDISNRNLHISELRIQGEAAAADANNRLAAARWQYDLRLARLAEQKRTLDRNLQTVESTLDASEGSLRQGEGDSGALLVTTPVAGLLTRLHVAVPGTSVKPGGIVATILPEGSKPSVIAHLANKDVGFVRPGVRAWVRIDAFPSAQFGSLPAQVTRVFPDPEGSNFIVKLVLSLPSINVHGVAAPLFPGLQVHVDLLTRERRLVDLLFDRS